MSQQGGIRKWIGEVTERWIRSLRGTSKSLNKTLGALAEVREVEVNTRSVDERSAISGMNYVNPVFWIIQFSQFTLRFMTSRQVVSGLQGFPAFLGILAPLVFAVWIVPGRNEQATYARGRMEFFRERKDFDTADFFARQVCFLLPQDSESLLRRAQLLKEMGRIDDARAIAAQLGVADEYLPAVAWLAENDLQQISKRTEPDEDQDRALLSSLTWILEKNPDHLQANFMLGTFHMMRGQYARALPLLQRVTELARPAQPEVWYSVAVTQKNLAKITEARASASLAADMLLDRQAREQYDVQKLIQTLRALLLAQRENDAEKLILQMLPQRKEAEANELRWLLGEIYAEWSKRLRTRPRRSAEDLAMALTLVYKGLGAASSHPKVVDELVQLSCTAEIEDTQLEQQLQIAIDSGVSPGLVHFIQGTRLLMADPPDVQRSLEHLKLAKSHNQAFPGLLNNMADAMVEAGSEDLDQALTLITQAIEMMPEPPQFYDTRGKILLKQGKPLEAVADFEKALAAPEIRRVVHSKLAEAFTALGQTADAARHAELASRIAAEPAQIPDGEQLAPGVNQTTPEANPSEGIKD